MSASNFYKLQNESRRTGAKKKSIINKIENMGVNYKGKDSSRKQKLIKAYAEYFDDKTNKKYDELEKELNIKWQSDEEDKNVVEELEEDEEEYFQKQFLPGIMNNLNEYFGENYKLSEKTREFFRDKIETTEKMKKIGPKMNMLEMQEVKKQYIRSRSLDNKKDEDEKDINKKLTELKEKINKEKDQIKLLESINSDPILKTQLQNRRRLEIEINKITADESTKRQKNKQLQDNLNRLDKLNKQISIKLGQMSCGSLGLKDINDEKVIVTKEVIKRKKVLNRISLFYNRMRYEKYEESKRYNKKVRKHENLNYQINWRTNKKYIIYEKVDKNGNIRGTWYKRRVNSTKGKRSAKQRRLKKNEKRLKNRKIFLDNLYKFVNEIYLNQAFLEDPADYNSLTYEDIYNMKNVNDVNKAINELVNEYKITDNEFQVFKETYGHEDVDLKFIKNVRKNENSKEYKNNISVIKVQPKKEVIFNDKIDEVPESEEDDDIKDFVKDLNKRRIPNIANYKKDSDGTWHNPKERRLAYNQRIRETRNCESEDEYKVVTVRKISQKLGKNKTKMIKSNGIVEVIKTFRNHSMDKKYKLKKIEEIPIKIPRTGQNYMTKENVVKQDQTSKKHEELKVNKPTIIYKKTKIKSKIESKQNKQNKVSEEGQSKMIYTKPKLPILRKSVVQNQWVKFRLVEEYMQMEVDNAIELTINQQKARAAESEQLEIEYLEDIIIQANKSRKFNERYICGRAVDEIAIIGKEQVLDMVAVDEMQILGENEQKEDNIIEHIVEQFSLECHKEIKLLPESINEIAFKGADIIKIKDKDVILDERKEESLFIEATVDRIKSDEAIAYLQLLRKDRLDKMTQIKSRLEEIVMGKAKLRLWSYKTKIYNLEEKLKNAEDDLVNYQTKLLNSENIHKNYLARHHPNQCERVNVDKITISNTKNIIIRKDQGNKIGKGPSLEYNKDSIVTSKNRYLAIYNCNESNIIFIPKKKEQEEMDNTKSKNKEGDTQTTVSKTFNKTTQLYHREVEVDKWDKDMFNTKDKDIKIEKDRMSDKNKKIEQAVVSTINKKTEKNRRKRQNYNNNRKNKKKLRVQEVELDEKVEKIEKEDDKKEDEKVEEVQEGDDNWLYKQKEFEVEEKENKIKNIQVKRGFKAKFKFMKSDKEMKDENKKGGSEFTFDTINQYNDTPTGEEVNNCKTNLMKRSCNKTKLQQIKNEIDRELQSDKLPGEKLKNAKLNNKETIKTKENTKPVQTDKKMNIILIYSGKYKNITVQGNEIVAFDLYNRAAQAFDLKVDEIALRSQGMKIPRDNSGVILHKQIQVEVTVEKYVAGASDKSADIKIEEQKNAESKMETKPPQDERFKPGNNSSQTTVEVNKIPDKVLDNVVESEALNIIMTENGYDYWNALNCIKRMMTSNKTYQTINAQANIDGNNNIIMYSEEANVLNSMVDERMNRRVDKNSMYITSPEYNQLQAQFFYFPAVINFYLARMATSNLGDDVEVAGIRSEDLPITLNSTRMTIQDVNAGTSWFRLSMERLAQWQLPGAMEDYRDTGNVHFPLASEDGVRGRRAPTMRIKIKNIVSNSNQYTATVMWKQFYTNLNQDNQYADGLQKQLKFTDAGLLNQYQLLILEDIMTQRTKYPARSCHNVHILKLYLYLIGRCLNTVFAKNWNSASKYQILLNEFNEFTAQVDNPIFGGRQIRVSWCSYEQLKAYLENPRLQPAQEFRDGPRPKFIPIGIRELRDRDTFMMELLARMPYPKFANYFGARVAASTNRNNNNGNTTFETKHCLFSNLTNNILIDGYQNIVFVIIGNDAVEEDPDVQEPWIYQYIDDQAQAQEFTLGNYFNGFAEEKDPTVDPSDFIYSRNNGLTDNDFIKLINRYIYLKGWPLTDSMFKLAVKLTCHGKMMFYDNHDGPLSMDTWPHNFETIAYGTREEGDITCMTMEEPNFQQELYEYMNLVRVNECTILNFNIKEDVQMLYSYYAYNMALTASKIYRKAPIPLKLLFNRNAVEYEFHKKIINTISPLIFQIKEPDIITTIQGQMDIPMIRAGKGLWFGNVSGWKSMCIYNNTIDLVEDMSGKFNIDKTAGYTTRFINIEEVQKQNIAVGSNVDGEYKLSIKYGNNFEDRKRLNKVVSDYLGKCYHTRRNIEWQINSTSVNVINANPPWHMIFPYISITPFTSWNYADQNYSYYGSDPIQNVVTMIYLTNEKQFWIYNDENAMYSFRLLKRDMHVRTTNLIISGEKLHNVALIDGPRAEFDDEYTV